MLVGCAVFVIPETLVAQSAPEKAAVGFYKWYLHQLNAQRSPEYGSARVNAAVSARLRRWFKSKEGREWDADYIIDAQDWDPKWEGHIQTSPAVIDGNAAEFRVTLGPRVKVTGGMSPHTLRMKMVKERGAWKIDRINGR
jgi:hypothetical protein